MELKKNIKQINIASLIFLLLAVILSIFNIGYRTKPIYGYISSPSINTLISILFIGTSFLIFAYLTFLFISKKYASLFQLSILMLIANLCIDFVLGGNVVLIVACILNIVVNFMNLNILQIKLFSTK